MKQLIGFGICDICGKEVSVYKVGDRYCIETFHLGIRSVMLYNPVSRDIALQIMQAQILDVSYAKHTPRLPMVPRLYVSI